VQKRDESDMPQCSEVSMGNKNVKTEKNMSIKPEKKYDRSGILTLSFAHMLHDIYSSFLAPLLPLLIDKLAFSYSLAGFLSLASRLPSLLNPLIGLLSDKVSLKYFVIVTPAVTCITMSLIGVAPNYAVLAALMLVMGISAAFFHVPSPVIIRRLSGDRVGKGMSYYMLGGEFARTLGPLIVLGAVSLWGLEGTWKLIPFGLGASIFFYYKLRNIDNGRSHSTNDSKTGVRATVRKYLPLLFILTGFTASRSMMKVCMTLFLPAYLTYAGNSVWFSGISLSILEFSGALGTLYFGSKSDKIGRKSALMIISILSPFCILSLIYIDGVWTIPTLLVAGFLLLAPTPVMLALVQESARERPAFVNGLFMSMSFIVGALAAVFVGWLSDIYGLETTFIISGITAFLAVLFSMGIPGNHKPVSPIENTSSLIS